jgi:hypothetical protein
MLNFTSYTADSHLTSSSPSTAEDSFCKTAMSRREDIVSCIDDEDRTVGLDRAGARFVQEIFSPVGDRGVNRSRSVSMAGAEITRTQQDPNRGSPGAGHPYSKQGLQAGVSRGK